MAINPPTQTGQIEQIVTLNESRMTKMCRTDRSIVSFWIVFMWIILAAVYFQVGSLADSSSSRMIALAAGLLVGLFNTAALIAVSGHLKGKKNQLYSEDIYHQEKIQAEGGKSWDFVKLFDVLFILILCYISLLTPMLLRGKVLVGGGGGGGMQYTFTWVSLLLCIGAAVIFGYFLITHSEKELKSLINNVYGKTGGNR